MDKAKRSYQKLSKRQRRLMTREMEAEIRSKLGRDPLASPLAKIGGSRGISTQVRRIVKKRKCVDCSCDSIPCSAKIIPCSVE